MVRRYRRQHILHPVYKRFFDIEDSVKANRLETRERAIANGWETKIDENGHVVSDDVVSVTQCSPDGREYA